MKHFVIPQVAQKFMPSTSNQWVSANEIESLKEELENSWQSVLAIPSTQKVHSVTPSGPCKVAVAQLSTSEFKIHSICKRKFN